MEKKTIGQFIAALRKANGMTQKQLSEKLNVSDKAVSRWERDECAPDLSLIPVIAEIFGVTSDEILRGERRFSEEHFSEAPLSNGKSQKQMEHILNDTKLKFGIRSIISLGVAVVGLLGAMLCNFGFLRAHIGFIVGCILFLAAAVCEAIFVKLAFASVSGEDFDNDSLNLYKKGFFDKAYSTYASIFVIFAVTLPLIHLVSDAYWGLTFDSWFVYGLIYGLVALVVCLVLKIVAVRIALKNKLFTLSEKEKEKTNKIFKWDKKCLIILACVLAVTFLFQWAFNQFVSLEMFYDPIVFTSVEDFVEFMETPAEKNNTYYAYDGLSKIEFNEDTVFNIVNDYTYYENVVEVSPAPDDYFQYDDGIHYFDQYGNEISEEEALTRAFHGKNDEVITTYVERNNSVSYYTVDWDGDELEKITVYTFDTVRQFNTLWSEINDLFFVLYFVEAIIISIVWCLKRIKIK